MDVMMSGIGSGEHRWTLRYWNARIKAMTQ